jgi:eukaryotic-like serine/threonine-protein kinase
MKAAPDNPSRLTASMWEEIDRICLAFEQAWQQQTRPPVQPYLESGNIDTRLPLLHELLRLDIDYRIRGGEHPELSDYESDFPQELSTIKAALNEVRSDTVDGRKEQAVTATKVVPPRDPPMPARLGRYQIHECVGSGGCGAVHKAYDNELQRHVAIKIPHQGRFANAAAKEMFLNEARTLATLRHPGIVPVHDVGFSEAGDGSDGGTTCFIVSEYMDGGNLADYAANHRVTHDEAARIVISLAEALHYAHGKGLVHRDVKLTNILRDAEGKTYIADFGLALRDEDIGTGCGFAGTPANMSPEQARGDGNLVDARTDVYGLGVVLYELLAGHRPFDGNNIASLLEQIARREPKPLRQIDDQIPRELERICLKALSKRPSNRYSTAMDMADDLRRFKRQGAGSIWTSVAAMWSMAAIVVAVVTLSLIVGRRGSSPREARDQSSSSTAIRTMAVLPFRPVLDKEPYAGIGMADALITKLSNLRQIVVRPMEHVRRYVEPTSDPIELGRHLQVDAVLEGSIQQTTERTRTTVRLLRVADGHSLWAATFDEESVDPFTVQDAIAAQVVRALALQLTADEQARLKKHHTENRQAYESYVKGRYHWNQRADVGRGGLGKAIKHFHDAIEADPLYALAYCGLAESYALLNVYSASLDETAFPRARAAARQAVELDKNLTEARAILALVTFYHDWDWDRAEAEFRRAIDLNPNYAAAHQWYGEMLYFSQRFDESIAELKIAAELDPLSPVIAGLQGTPYMWRRDYARARQEFLKAEQRHPNSVIVLYGLGLCLEQEAKWDEALIIYRQQATLVGQAFVLARMGQQLEARSTLKALMDLQPHPPSPYNVGLIHIGLGEYDEAFHWLEKAYKARDEQMVRLLVDPKLDPIRDDPRFRKLLKDVGWVKTHPSKIFENEIENDNGSEKGKDMDVDKGPGWFPCGVCVPPWRLIAPGHQRNPSFDRRRPDSLLFWKH